MLYTTSQKELNTLQNSSFYVMTWISLADRSVQFFLTGSVHITLRSGMLIVMGMCSIFDRVRTIKSPRSPANSPDSRYWCACFAMSAVTNP